MIERCMFVICLDKTVDQSDSVVISTVNRFSSTDANNNSLHVNGYQDYSTSDEYEVSDEMSQTAFQMLHGCNSRNNSGNRWFDKTMQFIISEDGYCGLNYEHSPAEGIVVIELSEHLFRYMYVI